ncbi:MAG: MATE family efflux transporter [Euryarchaeota archaeon]|nr:MATE family efflux transporter [Euryarchaeota archaeon]
MKLTLIKKFKKTHISLKEKMGRPEKEEILQGDIISVLFKLAWPLMIATFLRTLYNLVDTFWLGHLPQPEATYSVGAVSMSWSFVFLMMSAGIGFGVAAVALISQHTGSKQFDEASRDAGQLYFLAITFSVLMGIAGYFLSPYFLDILTGNGEEAAVLAQYGKEYMQVICLGLPFMFLFFAFRFILRGWGDTLTALKITALSVLLNLIIDPVLIFGMGPVPKMGVQGAAIATVSTRGIGALYGMYLLFSGALEIKLDVSYLVPDPDRIKKYISVGVPASVGRMGSAAGFIILWALINRLPNQEIASAGYGVGNRILNITFLVLGGLAMAMSTMIGQSLGADMKKRADKVAKRGLLSIVALTAVFAFSIFLFRNALIGIFIPGKTEVVKMGAEFLMIFSFSMPFFGLFRGISSIFGGSGHTKQQMGVSLIRLWGFRLPLAYVFAFVVGMYARGIFLGMALSNIIAAAIAVALYSKGWWREKVI